MDSAHDDRKIGEPTEPNITSSTKTVSATNSEDARTGTQLAISTTPQFTQCRQSIEEAVNSSAWPRAQRIGIECAAKLNLGKSTHNFADLTFWLGRAYEGGGQLPEALDSFNQAYSTAVELGSDRMAVDNLLGKARVLRSLERTADARACLGEVLLRAEKLVALERETYREAARKELATF